MSGGVLKNVLTSCRFIETQKNKSYNAMDHQTLCASLLVNVLKRSVQQDCFQLSKEQTLIPCF